MSSLLSFGSAESITIKSAWQVGRVDMFFVVSPFDVFVWVLYLVRSKSDGSRALPHPTVEHCPQAVDNNLLLSRRNDPVHSMSLI